jgi:hypothetical protein
MPQLDFRNPLLSNGHRRFTRGQWQLINETAPFTLLAGGVGSGKTTGLCTKLLQLREQNWGFPGLLVAPTLPLLKAVTLREFLRIYRLTYPDAPTPRVKDPSGDRHLEFFDGGAPLFLRTAQNPESIEGFSVGYAGGDEARHWRTHEAYRNLIARLRLRSPFPQIVLSSTPALGWMSDEFQTERPGRKLIIAPTRENIHNLREGYLEDLQVSYSPRIQRAILDGEFVPMEGVCFEEFDGRAGSKWIVDWMPSKRDLDRCPVFLAVDPGWRHSAWLFIIEVRPLEWVVFDELILDNCSDMSAVQMINQRGYPIDEIWVDPAAEAKDASGRDTKRVLKHINVRDRERRSIRMLTRRYREVAWGVDKLRVLLGGYEGYPVRIRFASWLLEYERSKERGIVKDLTCLRYPELRDGRPITDEPLKDGITDHSTDALRYFAGGRVLMTPLLRNRDPELLKDKKLGYRLAA